MPSRKILDLHPYLRPLCDSFLANCMHDGIKVGLSCTYRSCDEQDALYEDGRTKPGDIKTYARGGQSPHNCTDPDGSPASKAFDFFIYGSNGSLNWDTSHPHWHKAIQIGQDLGLVSGSKFSKFKDYPHMEMPNWRKV